MCCTPRAERWSQVACAGDADWGLHLRCHRPGTGERPVQMLTPNASICPAAKGQGPLKMRPGLPCTDSWMEPGAPVQAAGSDDQGRCFLEMCLWGPSVRQGPRLLTNTQAPSNGRRWRAGRLAESGGGAGDGTGRFMWLLLPSYVLK